MVFFCGYEFMSLKKIFMFICLNCLVLWTAHSKCSDDLHSMAKQYTDLHTLFHAYIYLIHFYIYIRSFVAALTGSIWFSQIYHLHENRRRKWKKNSKNDAWKRRTNKERIIISEGKRIPLLCVTHFYFYTTFI